MNVNAAAEKDHIHIVGSGLVGPLAAIYLARQGYRISLYERRPDMRRHDVPAGRSINLAVTARGLNALEQVGLREKALEIAIPMRGRMIHSIDGATDLQPYSQKEGEHIYAASRGLLNVLLLEEADKYDNVSIAFEKRCTDYDINNKTLSLQDERDGSIETIAAPVVIGADGAWSAVRKAMLESVPNFNYAQSFLEYGYKELVIPAAAGGSFQMEKHALHIWPRKNYMLIALPNMDGSFTCTLFFPYYGEASFEKMPDAAAVEDFFRREFPDALALMPGLADDFFANPTGALATVKCAPWHVGGQALLIGDAAHAIVPFYGQGMNCGFEDCAALGALIEGRGAAPDWQNIFQQFEAQRKPNADAIAQMALENFTEMRDSVADPEFQLRKKVGFALEQRFPGRFIPRYSMVVFHPEIPYAEAQARSAVQERILQTLCADIDDESQIDWQQAEQLLG